MTILLMRNWSYFSPDTCIRNIIVPGVIRAFSEAPLTGEKLTNYCKAVNNMAATKRMGFLAELFEKKGLNSFIRFAKDQVKDSYNPFDPQGSGLVNYNAEWKLRLNISKEEILDIANKQY